MSNLYELDKSLDFLNDTNLLESYEEEFLLEYAGNPEYNAALRELMKEMEKGLNDFEKEILSNIDELDKIFKLVESESKKKTPDVKKIARQALASFNKINDEVKSQDYSDYIDKYNNAFKGIKKVCRKLSIKYNDVIITDKKEFDKKLEKAWKDINNNPKVKNWIMFTANDNPKNVKAFDDAIEKLRIEDNSNAGVVNEKVIAIYNWTFGLVRNYLGNINYLRRRLNLEKENGIIYNAVNKLIKTKPEQRK